MNCIYLQGINAYGTEAVSDSNESLKEVECLMPKKGRKVPRDQLNHTHTVKCIIIKEEVIFYNSTKKRQHYFDILKAFFVRHSSEYKTSDSDRKVNRNTHPDAVTRDRMRLIDPKSGQLEPIHHCCLVEEL